MQDHRSGADVPHFHDLEMRLWRARRRHDHIDALLVETTAGWELTFVHREQVMIALTFPDREAAVADATSRLAVLQRAGWNVHW